MSDKTAKKGYKKSAVVALGYFDGVHQGHKKVLALAKEKAENSNSVLVALSFNGNLRAYFKKGEKSLYTASERKYLLKKSGVKKIISLPVKKEFLSLTGEEFLTFLSQKYDIKCYACGKDYIFGSDKKNAEFLISYAKEKGIETVIAKDGEIDGEKVSATAIKEYLKTGKIERANEYLGEPYFITGKVFSDRHIGTKLGFPTVNLKINKEKSPLLSGVYGGHIVLDEKRYDCVINYGTRPTFSLDKKLIEAHIIGYSGNLYGKTVRIFFDFFIRGVMSFKDGDALKDRIKKDIEYLKEKTK